MESTLLRLYTTSLNLDFMKNPHGNVESDHTGYVSHILIYFLPTCISGK